MSLKAGAKKQQVFSTCTLKELCPEDKQKVAQLVKQVVELGKENQQLKAAAITAASAAEKLRQIQNCNKQAVKENCSLKSKLGQAITVLRMYHHKVQGLDAALRALQHSSAADTPVSTQPQQQQDEQQDTQQEQQQQADAADPLPLPAPPTGGSTPATTAAAAAGADAATCAQQQHTASDQAGCVSSPSCPSAQQPAQQQCLCNRLLCRGLQGPVMVPGSSLTVSLPLQQLQAWQLQDNSLFAEQLVSQPRTVLQFDASVGTRGAYVVHELPQPQQLHTLAGNTVAASPSQHTGSPAPAAMLQLLAQQQASPQRQDQQQQQQQQQPEAPQRISAGGAATAAAAAAASSALAAVKAAAAVCAATPWEPDLSSCSISSLHHQQQAVQSVATSSAGFPHPAQQLPAHSRAAWSEGSQAGGVAGGHQAAAAGFDPWDRTRSSHQLGGQHMVSASDFRPEPGVGVQSGVEEVPVLDMASVPVHVLVQNEKSSSSLHQACARVTLAGGMAEGPTSPAPPAAVSAADNAAAGGPGSAAAWAGSVGGVMMQQEGPDLWSTGPEQYGRLVGSAPGPASQGNLQQVQRWAMQQQQQQQAEARQQLSQPPSAQQHAESALPVQHSYAASSASPASAFQQQQQQQQWGAAQQLPPWDQFHGVPRPAAASSGSKGVPAGPDSGVPCPVDVTGSGLAAQCHNLGAVPVRNQASRPVAAPPAAAGQLHPGVSQYHHGHDPNPWQQQHQQQHPQQPQQWFEQQQLQDGADVLPPQGVWGAGGATSRELLQKFDASLVDILAEVERLEQQQQLARQQLNQQQQRRRAPKLVTQQQNGVADYAGGRWVEGQQDQRVPAGAAGALAARQPYPGRPSQAVLLDQKQAQLQQRIMQLQQEEVAGRQFSSSGPYAAGHKVPGGQEVQSAGGWGYGSAQEYDADDVSDILNHLD